MDEFNGTCVAGAALMIFAGIRPQEVERLLWENIAIRDGCVILNSKHTKTGGARHVTILPVLAKWLKFCRDRTKPGPLTPICPKGWTIKWRKIRRRAGWGSRKRSWVPDCLRHTYASYHAKHFKDYNLLQMEMGHRSSSLLPAPHPVPEHEGNFRPDGQPLLGPDSGKGDRGNGGPCGNAPVTVVPAGFGRFRRAGAGLFPTVRNRYSHSARNGILPGRGGVRTA